MRKYFPITFLALLMLLLGSVATRSLCSSLGQNNQHGNSKPKHEDPRWPLVEYDSPGPADPREQAKRKSQEQPPRSSGSRLKALAYLSEDKTGIYSEFNVSAERVIKNQSASPVSAGDIIVAERIGGRIRMPSGHIHQYGISKQGMPKVGGRYVLFLGEDENEGFNILTGYELRGGKVFPLDGVDPADGSKLPNFAEHEGADEAVFLNRVENSLAQSSQQP